MASLLNATLSYRARMQSHTGAQVQVIKGPVTTDYATKKDLRGKKPPQTCEVLCRIYESAAEFVREADLSRQAVGEFDIECMQDVCFVGRYFDKWVDVIAATREPWAEGIEIIERLSARLDAHLPEPTDRRRRQRWDECNGDDVCLDRLRGGMPFWRQTRRETTTAPQNVTICVDISTLGEVGSDDIFWRGAVALVVAKHLEAAGYRVELWAVNATCVNRNVLFQSFRLKAAEDGLNLGLLAADLSGWFYRSVVFQSRHSTGFTESNNDMGGSRYVEPFMINHLRPGEDVTLIDLIWDEKAAHHKIGGVLAAYGAEIGATHA